MFLVEENFKKICYSESAKVKFGNIFMKIINLRNSLKSINSKSKTLQKLIY